MAAVLHFVWGFRAATNQPRDRLQYGARSTNTSTTVNVVLDSKLEAYVC